MKVKEEWGRRGIHFLINHRGGTSAKPNDIVWRVLDCTIFGGVVEHEVLCLLTLEAMGKNLMMELWLFELIQEAILPSEWFRF
jgi:hypothetical protein